MRPFQRSCAIFGSMRHDASVSQVPRRSMLDKNSQPSALDQAKGITQAEQCSNLVEVSSNVEAPL